MKEESWIRSILIAFSAAGLWFSTIVADLLYPVDNFYFNTAVTSSIKYPAILFDILILTGVYLLLLKFSDSAKSGWLKNPAQLAFFLLALLSFGAFGAKIIKWYSPTAPHTFSIVSLSLILPAIILFFCAAFAFKQNLAFGAINSNLKRLLLICAPFALLLCCQLLWFWYYEENVLLVPYAIKKTGFSEPPPQAIDSTSKIVWIIFDELDYAALTNADGNKVDLPDIHRLMNQSFVAENAFSPDVDTKESIPALLIGQPVLRAETDSARDSTLYLSQNPPKSISLRESKTILSEMREAGFKVGVVGWYHPYPRIFAKDLTYGFWSPMRAKECVGFAECSAELFVLSTENVPFTERFVQYFKSRYATTDQLNRNAFLTEKAEEAVANPELDFLFFHFSIPHRPFIGKTTGTDSEPESEKTRTLTGRIKRLLGDRHAGKTYFDSLEEVNNTVRRLRERLEATNQWDNTILIVSSDHWWRGKQPDDFLHLPEAERKKAVGDLRIPFIVKLPGQTSRFDYKQRFNTVITSELILAIAGDKIKNSHDLAGWLEEMRVKQRNLVEFLPDENSN